MNRRTLFLLPLSAILALAALSPGCGSEEADDAPPDDLTGAEAAYHHTREILSFGPRPPGSAALQKARNYLVEELARHGWQASTQSVERTVPQLGQVTFVNILARFGSGEGENLWRRPVKGVLGAHLDSKYYPDRKFLGADDAASAVGTILELARQLETEPDLANQLELVFFDGEEAFGPNITSSDGLYGSKAYALRWRTADQRPEFGIVLDMVGHKDLRIRYPSDTPPPLEEALLAAARAEGYADHYGKAETPILDDHVPLNIAGIPTIDIIGDFTNSPWWHTTADDLRIISKDSLEITLKVTRRMLGILLEEE